MRSLLMELSLVPLTSLVDPTEHRRDCARPSSANDAKWTHSGGEYHLLGGLQERSRDRGVDTQHNKRIGIL